MATWNKVVTLTTAEKTFAFDTVMAPADTFNIDANYYYTIYSTTIKVDATPSSVQFTAKGDGLSVTTSGARIIVTATGVTATKSGITLKATYPTAYGTRTAYYTFTVNVPVTTPTYVAPVVSTLTATNDYGTEYAK